MCPQVTSPTPRKQNNCPPKPTIPSPPEGLVINECGRMSGVNQSQKSLFMELTGPPSTPLNGLVLVFFGEDATELSVPIAGSTGKDGLFLVANDSRAGACVWSGNVFFVRHSLIFFSTRSRLMCLDIQPEIIFGHWNTFFPFFMTFWKFFSKDQPALRWITILHSLIWSRMNTRKHEKVPGCVLQIFY